MIQGIRAIRKEMKPNLYSPSFVAHRQTIRPQASVTARYIDCQAFISKVFHFSNSHRTEDEVAALQVCSSGEAVMTAVDYSSDGICYIFTWFGATIEMQANTETD
ncbi:hypothetical protein L1987_54116 [Smallanthus sonchifolius]|uniref:Uncharacterized protein n=1 Tax=Smallanthus sonchifolius TaxID=185202 RepID=A0ACB9E5W4_9ASTR|nr:hypothetical protein L1987_54116 [Smallanthus sonchifolius]